MDGTQYDSLDLSAASTSAAKATALSALIAASGYVVRFVDGAYVAFYQWRPGGSAPAFTDVASSDVAEDFGLLAADATEAPGPFTRTRTQDLTVTAAVTRRGAFPADGLARMRAFLRLRVEGYAALTADEQATVGVAFQPVRGYDVGEQVWLNDLLSVVEAVGGTRVTSLTVTDGTNAVSGVDVPLDRVWSLPLANITITLT